MKTMLVLFLVSATLLGCGTTATVARSDYDRVARENAALRAQLAAAPAATAPPPPVATATAPVPAVGVVPPPARPEPMGPPQNWAWLTPPTGCEEGPFSLGVINWSGRYLTLMIDGRAITVRGGDGPLPHLPPGETAYLCLSDLGNHTVAGVAYTPRFGVLQEAGRFRDERYYGTGLIGAHSRHYLYVEGHMVHR